MFDKIRKILGNIINPDIGIDEDTALGDLNIDSLDKLEVKIELEEELNIDIPDDIFEDNKTVGDIGKEIEKYKS